MKLSVALFQGVLNDNNHNGVILPGFTGNYCLATVDEGLKDNYPLLSVINRL